MYEVYMAFCQDPDISCLSKGGQFICRRFRGPTIPSCTLAHSLNHIATLATSSADRRDPIPIIEL